MTRVTAQAIVALIIVAAAGITQAGETKNAPATNKIPKGAKVYVAAMTDGFDTYLKAAIVDKKVPLQLTSVRDEAEYEITGTSETMKAGTAKKVLAWDWRSNEEASIRLINLKSSEVTWAYSVHKQSSAHGKKSTAEACAKHLKDEMEK